LFPRLNPNLPFSPNVEILADSGYQGLQKIKSNVKLPIKKNETGN
jgi:hypothetical protein